MSEQGGLPEARLAEIAARCAAATPGPLEVGVADPNIEAGEWFRRSARHGQGSIFVVWAPRHPNTIGEAPNPKHAAMSAITGNGPAAEANAEFYAHCPDDIREMVAELGQVRQQRDEACQAALPAALRIGRLEAMLRRIQWRVDGDWVSENGVPSEPSWCPICEDVWQHAEDCELAKLLPKEGEGER